MLLSDLLLRDVIARGLHIYREDEDTLVRIFEDESYYHPRDVQDFLNKWYSSDVTVSLNYPSPGMDLPSVSIVQITSEERDSNQVLGDYAGTMEETQPSGSLGVPSTDSSDESGEVVTAYTELLTQHRNEVYRCVITTTDDVFTAFLSEAVRFIAYLAKVQLSKYHGLENMSLSMSDFRFRREFWPHPTYSKSLEIRSLTRAQVRGSAIHSSEYGKHWDSLVPALSDVKITTFTSTLTPVKTGIPAGVK